MSPHPVPIAADNEEDAREDFRKLFLCIFGHSTVYSIHSVIAYSEVSDTTHESWCRCWHCEMIRKEDDNARSHTTSERLLPSGL